jgi:hypothetical protein
MGHDDRALRAARESPPSFTTSSRGPVAASAVFVVIFGGMAALSLAALAGLTPEHPPVWLTGGVAIASLALTAMFVVLLVGSIGNRFAVDAQGLHATSRAGGIELPWSDIATVRVVLLVRRPVVPDLLVPTPLDRTTQAHLEFTLVDAAASEARQPRLRRVRIRKPTAGGATHRFGLPSARLIDTADPADYSPALQALLPSVAGAALLPTEVRSTWTA